MYHLTPIASNRKTGPIPTSTSGRETCPKQCPFCYALFGPQRLHWDKVSSGERGVSWIEFCRKIKRLARYVYWRHNVSGDLPHELGQIIWHAMVRLVQANKGKHGWTYTHHKPTPHNVRVVQYCNDNGFTVNWSADNATQADGLAYYGPVAVLMPTGTPKVSYTPQGHKANLPFVHRCTATIYDRILSPWYSQKNCSKIRACQLTRASAARCGSIPGSRWIRGSAGLTRTPKK